MKQKLVAGGAMLLAMTVGVAIGQDKGGGGKGAWNVAVMKNVIACCQPVEPERLDLLDPLHESRSPDRRCEEVDSKLNPIITHPRSDELAHAN